MRRAGRVVRTAQGMAIARCGDDEHPGFGADLVDERLEPAGRVVDVMGPTARPFLVIDPRDRPLAALLDEKLYVR